MDNLVLKSKYDGLELSLLKIVPSKKARGIVQISHGMAEYKERYIPFMEYLKDNGYVVIIHDHRGHGKSIKCSADLGYFYDTLGEGIVEDLHQVTMYIKKEYPKLPVYLFGHSMGSMVVRKYLKKYDKDIDKLIVCGSPSKNSKVGVAIMLVKFMQTIKGDRYRSKFIDKLTFGNYSNNFSHNTSKNAWICSDQDVVKSYDKDDACGYIFTLNGFLNLYILMRDIYKEKGYLVNNPDLKILFIAGALDPVIINRKKWEDAQLFLKNVGYQNIKGIIYSDMRHEILNEIEKEKVYEDVLNFISNNN